MAVSATHRGWLTIKDRGILAAVYDGAQEGTRVLATNTALDGVFVGTPVTPALAVDSMVISNTVASGDVLIAANNGGNSQAWVWVDSSAGTMTLYGAGTAIAVLSSTAFEFEDDKLLALGNDQDQVLVNRSTVLNATTALTGVILGTPVTPALAANSLIISNTTASGDVLVAANNGGHSQAWLWIDSSAGTMTLYGAGTAAAIVSATAVEVEDSILLALGNDQDQVAINRATPLNADTALTGVLLGTPVVAAIPANSLIVSNTTEDGDQVFAGQTGGNSQEWLRYDASAKLVVFNEDSGDVDFRVESNGNANMLVIDGGLDAIGIGGAAVTSQTLTVTNAALAATAGRVLKLSGTVAAPNHGDGYGALEVDITASGTVAGTTAASSTWLNFAGSSVPGGNMICTQNNGIYLPAGITASSAKMVMGMRMQYVADDGANPGSLFCFSTNIYSNVLTAIFDVNAIGDLGGSTGAQTGNDYKIPLLKDETANQVWYVNVYHT